MFALNHNKRLLCLSKISNYQTAKQFPRSDPKFNSLYRHPRKYVIRRRRPQQHRPDAMKTEEEILWDQILLPHFGKQWKEPDYAYEVKSDLQSRHMERNIELGPASDATKLYGPDLLTYEECKTLFTKARNGFLGIVIMAGEAGDTMEDYVYFDNKLAIMKSGANTFRFDDHIVYAYINNERPDLLYLKEVLNGCEEGEHEVLHFVYKEDTENLEKVMQAIYRHPFMELFGGIVNEVCYTPSQLKEYTKLNYEKEVGNLLGVLEHSQKDLVSLLDQIPQETIAILSSIQSDICHILDQYVRDQEKK